MRQRHYWGYYSGKYDEKYVVENEDLLIGMDSDFVACFWHNGKALLNQRVCKLQNFRGVNKNYIYYLIQKELNAIHAATQVVTVKHISAAQIGKIKIPLPPLEVQEKIVAESALIESARKISEIYEQKIKDTISKLWYRS